MKKLIKLEFDNTTRERKTEDSFSELYSHDKNNGSFEFEILNDTLTTEQVIALFKFTESNKIWKTTGTVEGNKVKVTFDTTLITQNETVICYLYFDEEQRTSDTFRFKFKVKVSEIDKLSRYEVKERFINNTVIVDRLDVVTKDELQEILKTLDLSSISTDGLLTEKKANGLYAKISELEVLERQIPSVSSFITEEMLRTTKNDVVKEIDNKLEDYALKTNIPEPYNDTNLVNRVSDLEQKQDKDTIYNDEPIKERLTALENGNFATKDELKEIKNSKATVDTSNFITNQILESKNFVTEETLNNKGYAKTSEIPAPYNDKMLSDRVTVLENKQDNDTVYNDTPIKERLTALENKTTTNQTLSINNNTLTISNGNSVVLPTNQFEIHGTGMPNGVVTAEIGTTYVDKNKTNGALKWIKTTDGGNQGWEVLIGDTGWRTLNSVSRAGNSFIKIRRVNNLVTYQFGGLQWGWFGVNRRNGPDFVRHNSSGDKGAKVLRPGGIPVGFRSESSLIGGIYSDAGKPYGIWYLGGVTDSNFIQFTFNDPIPTDRDIGDIRVSAISYLTNEPWPTQLP